VRRWLLPLEVLAARGHALMLLGLVLLLAALVALVLQTTYASRMKSEARAALQAHGAGDQQPRASTNAERLLAFERALGRREELDSYVGQVFIAAKRRGVGLALGEYRLTQDLAGGFQRYQMVLPINGSSNAIQAFSQQVLLDLRFAALEEISLKRATIDAMRVEGKLRFVLFLRSGSEPARSVTGARSALAAERP
jgi:hypothetical protein